MKKYTLMLLGLFLYSCLVALPFEFQKSYTNSKGIKAAKAQQKDKAFSLFNDNAVRYPEDGRLQYNLGTGFYQKGQYDQAIKAWQSTLDSKKQPAPSQTWYNIGNAYYQKQEWQNALKAYKQSLLADPKNQNARYNYELVKRQLQQNQQQQQQNQQQQQQKPQQQDRKKQEAEKILQALDEKEQSSKRKQDTNGEKITNPKYW